MNGSVSKSNGVIPICELPFHNLSRRWHAHTKEKENKQQGVVRGHVISGLCHVEVKNSEIYSTQIQPI